MTTVVLNWPRGLCCFSLTPLWPAPIPKFTLASVPETPLPDAALSWTPDDSTQPRLVGPPLTFKVP